MTQLDRTSILSRRGLQDAHLPQRSWWVGVARADWPAVVAAEEPRIRLTAMSMSTRLAFGPDGESLTRLGRRDED